MVDRLPKSDHKSLFISGLFFSVSFNALKYKRVFEIIDEIIVWGWLDEKS